MLQPESGAISDGYSVFLRGRSDPKRYAKLEGELSVYRLDGVTLDTAGGSPLRIDRVLDIREFMKQWLGRHAGLPVRFLAILRDDKRHPILVNAERLRCATLVCGHEHLWSGAGDRVYLCDAAPEELGLFADGPAPVAMIMPLLPASRLMHPLEEYEREHGPCDADTTG